MVALPLLPAEDEHPVVLQEERQMPVAEAVVEVCFFYSRHSESLN